MSRSRQAGVSLIEMMIAIVILALLLALGLPNMAVWLNNSRLRTTGETVLTGLQLARTEAIRRNTTVRFQLVTNLSAGCALSTQGTSWVVSLEDATGACNAAASDTVSPMLVQAKAGDEGGGSVQLQATGAATAHFNGLGRITSPSGAANMTRIDIANPVGGVCQHVDPDNGTMRCLQINISTGGEVKMCDPAVADATDPRRC